MVSKSPELTHKILNRFKWLSSNNQSTQQVITQAIQTPVGIRVVTQNLTIPNVPAALRQLVVWIPWVYWDTVSFCDGLMNLKLSTASNIIIINSN